MTGRIRAALWVIALAVFCGPAAAEDLTVTTIERKPFAFVEEGEWTGFSVELWDMVAKEIGTGTKITPVSQFTDLLGKVRDGDADVAAANVSITLAREEQMDFSQPIFDAGLTVLTPKGSATDGFFSDIWQQMLLLWLLGISATLLIYEAIQWYLQRRSRYAAAPTEEGTANRRTWNGLGMALSGALAVGVGIFIAQLMAGLIIKSSSTAVRSVEDLYGRNIGTTNGSTSAEFLESFAIDYQGFDSIENLFIALEDGRIDAIFHDVPILAYYAATDGKGAFEPSPRVFLPEKYGFALPDGHPRMEAINRALLQIREDGRYADLYARWFGGEKL